LNIDRHSTARLFGKVRRIPYSEILLALRHWPTIVGGINQVSRLKSPVNVNFSIERLKLADVPGRSRPFSGRVSSGRKAIQITVRDIASARKPLGEIA
jgi:Na+/serine symporter